MGDGSEAVAAGDTFLEFLGEAIFNLDDACTASADEVMMMVIVTGGDEFEASCAISEIESLDKAKLLEEVDGTIDGGEVARKRKVGADFFNGQGVVFTAKQFEQSFAGAGELPGVAPKMFGESGDLRDWLFCFLAHG